MPMNRILVLSAAITLLSAADVSIPLTVLDQQVEQPTVDGKPAVVVDGRIALPVGVSTSVAWQANGAPATVTVVVLTRDSATQAPAWHADPGTVFEGGSNLRLVRDHAASSARVAMMRQAAGAQQGRVSGSISGSRMEMVITIAADAADQPAYTVPEGPMATVRQSAANGTAGSPWVRCWARAQGGKVELDQPAKR